MSNTSENRKKLKAFFEEEYQELTSYVSAKLRASINRNAEDIVQDVALKLFSGAEGYSPINNVASFVYRSMKNKVIDIMRKGKEDVNNSEFEDEYKLNEFVDLLYGVSDNSYSDELKLELKESILGLKPAYRDIILAIDFEGYTYKEISEETNIPIGTLMSHRHRAMAFLVKSMKTKKK